MRSLEPQLPPTLPALTGKHIDKATNILYTHVNRHTDNEISDYGFKCSSFIPIALIPGKIQCTVHTHFKSKMLLFGISKIAHTPTYINHIYDRVLSTTFERLLLKLTINK